MKKQIYTQLLIVVFVLCSALSQGQTWITISTDSAGDGHDPAFLDGIQFDYYYSQSTDSIWFKITVDTITPIQQNAFGVNVMVNIPGGGNTFNFWGQTNSFAYHMLLTAWVTGTPPSTYNGTIGISDAAGIGISNYTSLFSNNISINVDANTNEIILGVNRADFIPTSSFSGSDTLTVEVQAAVGSNISWNDDIYSHTASMTIIRNTTGINSSIDKYSDINVFHNSASHLLFIDLGKTERVNAKIIITGVSGKLIREIECANSSLYSINTDEIAQGIYFVSVSTNNHLVSTKKIVIE